MRKSQKRNRRYATILSAVLKAIAFQGAVDDARRAAEVIQGLQLTRDTLRELRSEVSGLVDIPYLTQEHITALKQALIQDNDAATV